MTSTVPTRASLGYAVGLSACRGALAAAVFVTLPAVVTGAAWVLFYVLPVAVPIGAVMGLLCAPVVWWIARSNCSLRTAAFAAADVAACAWVAAVLVVLLLSGSRMTNNWLVFLVAPAPVGAAAAAWTLVTLRRRPGVRPSGGSGSRCAAAPRTASHRR